MIKKAINLLTQFYKETTKNIGLCNVRFYHTTQITGFLALYFVRNLKFFAT